MWKAFLDTLPRGYTLEESDWQRRHRLLLLLLAFHVPALAVFAVASGTTPSTVALVLVPPSACVVLGHLLRGYRRTASVTVTAGLVYCSGALVGLTGGAIEAHFHFFIIIGFIALYQDWAPFLFNIGFVVISHGIGSVWQQSLIFNHSEGQSNPWVWSLIHGVAVLFACVGMMLFWRFTEESQQEKDALARRLAEAEIGKRQFTSDLLVNLARRNQSMLHRQLDIINQLEASEQDPEALADLFRLDHLTTRVRRNAESLLVLSGEQPPRTWSDPVPLRDVLRAAIAETEDLERVVFIVDERPAVAGHTVTDLTHLLAELTENAVRSSPPDSVVTIRARPNRADPGGHLLTVEDWGVGMPPGDLAEANTLLAEPPEVDLSVSQRLGFHVVARLAARHGIGVSLSATPGSGITAVVLLPSRLFEPVRTASAYGPNSTPALSAAAPQNPGAGTNGWAGGSPPAPRPPGRPDHGGQPAPAAILTATREPGAVRHDDVTPFTNGARVDDNWRGWWDPAAHGPRPAGPSTDQPGPMEPAVYATRSGAARPSVDRPALPTQRTPDPRPALPGTVAGPGSGGGAGSRGGSVGGLRRRVPQSHLAAELREPAAGGPAGPPPPPQHHAGAAHALSRYQASREAARAVTDSATGSPNDTAHGDVADGGWRG